MDCRCGRSKRYDLVIDGGIHRCSCGRKYRCDFRRDWGHDWVEIFSWKRLEDWVTGKLEDWGTGK